MINREKGFKWGYVLICIVLAAIGVCFIAFGNALKALAISIGVILSIFAIVFAIITISNTDRGLGFAFRIFLSVICLVGGIVTAVFYENSVDILIAIFSLLLIIDASFKLGTSAMSKRYYVSGWWLVMIFSVLTIIGAFFLIKFTPEAQNTASLILGLTMIISAINNFLSAFYITSFERRMENEIYYSRKRRENE